jgi:hypothetical protein
MPPHRPRLGGSYELLSACIVHLLSLAPVPSFLQRGTYFIRNAENYDKNLYLDLQTDSAVCVSLKHYQNDYAALKVCLAPRILISRGVHNIACSGRLFLKSTALIKSLGKPAPSLTDSIPNTQTPSYSETSTGMSSL